MKLSEAEARDVFRVSWPTSHELADVVFYDIFDKMKARQYHGFNHVIRLLDRYREVMGPGPIPERVVWFFFFHDKVYDPRRQDNEEKSASDLLAHVRNFVGLTGGESAKQVAALLSLGKSAQQVATWIRASKPGCGLEVDDPIGSFCLDADYSFLAEPWDTFLDDGYRIRREYSYVTDDVFLEGRVRFFEHVLAHPPIYRTELFRDRFEGLAANNMMRWLRERPPVTPVYVRSSRGYIVDHYSPHQSSPDPDP